MKKDNSKEIIFTFYGKTSKECIERFKKVFDTYCTVKDIISINLPNYLTQVSASDTPLNCPLILETDKYYFCLHSFERFQPESILNAVYSK